MIPGISIIVFLKCKDLGIRDASTRFCFSDLLCLWLGTQGATGGWLGRFVGPRTLQGPRTNEACSSLMEQIQEKQTCDVVPSGGPESLVERNRTLEEFVYVCVRVRERGGVVERGDKRKYLQYLQFLLLVMGVYYFICSVHNGIGSRPQ